MNNEGMQAQGPIGFANYLEKLRCRRNEYIAAVDRMTRLIDYVEAHSDCQEFLKLVDEMSAPQSQEV